MIDQSVMYDAVPASIYWKNIDGIYLGRNNFACKSMQAAELENRTTKDFVIGKCDYDLFPESIAEKYRKNDLAVMSHGEEMVTEEIVTLPNGNLLIQLSSKSPLLDKNNEICGIMGNTIDITQLKKHNNMSLLTIKLYQHHGLSKRQAECLFFLAQGMTMKQVAQALELSPKTVEHYISTVKDKLNCRTRVELFAKVSQMNFCK